MHFADQNFQPLRIHLTALAGSAIRGSCIGSELNYRLLQWQRVQLQVAAFAVSSITGCCNGSEFNYRLLHSQ